MEKILIKKADEEEEEEEDIYYSPEKVAEKDEENGVTYSNDLEEKKKVCNLRDMVEKQDRACKAIHYKCMFQENPDPWKWLTCQEQPPKVFVALREKVFNNLDNHAAPETRATPGQSWVRGWDDFKKGRDGPITGNQ